MTRADACREALKEWVRLAFIYGMPHERACAERCIAAHPEIEMWPENPPALDMWRITSATTAG
mgnify:CR=1 FL=1